MPEITRFDGAAPPEGAADADMPQVVETARLFQETRKVILDTIDQQGGMGEYFRKIDEYVEHLSETEVTALAGELRELVRDEPWMQAYHECGVDPFVQDLSQQEYPQRITFAKHLVRGDRGKVYIENESLAGYYDNTHGRGYVYIPDEENEPELANYLVNTEKPDDLCRRIASYLKYNNFGHLANTILHESIHGEQRPLGLFKKFYDREGEEAYYTRTMELREAQAWAEMLRNLRLFSLSERALFLSPKLTFSSTHEPHIVPNLDQDVHADFFSHTAGISDEAAMKFVGEELAHVSDTPTTGWYDFHPERVIAALQTIDKLNALGYSQKEIGGIIGKCWEWDDTHSRFPEIEAVIHSRMAERNMSKNDLELLIMNYKVQQMLDLNNSIIKKIDFLKKKGLFASKTDESG